MKVLTHFRRGHVATNHTFLSCRIAFTSKVLACLSEFVQPPVEKVGPISGQETGQRKWAVVISLLLLSSIPSQDGVSPLRRSDCALITVVEQGGRENFQKTDADIGRDEIGRLFFDRGSMGMECKDSCCILRTFPVDNATSCRDTDTPDIVGVVHPDHGFGRECIDTAAEGLDLMTKQPQKYQTTESRVNCATGNLGACYSKSVRWQNLHTHTFYQLPAQPFEWCSVNCTQFFTLEKTGLARIRWSTKRVPW